MSRAEAALASMCCSILQPPRLWRHQVRLQGALLAASELTQAQHSPTTAFVHKKQAMTPCLSLLHPGPDTPCLQSPSPIPQARSSVVGRMGSESREGASRNISLAQGWGGQGTVPAHLIQITERAPEESRQGQDTAQSHLYPPKEIQHITHTTQTAPSQGWSA